MTTATTAEPLVHQHEGAPSTLTIDTVYLTERRIVVLAQHPGEDDQYCIYERDTADDIWRCRSCGLTEPEALAIASGQLLEQHPEHTSGAMVGVRTQRWLESAWRARGGAY